VLRARCRSLTIDKSKPIDPHRVCIMPSPRMSRDLTDADWAVLNAIIPEPSRRKDGRGRPWKGRRSVLNGILWVLRTGAPWADVPDRYPLSFFLN
jgi:hypothetical protein